VIIDRTSYYTQILAPDLCVCVWCRLYKWKKLLTCDDRFCRHFFTWLKWEGGRPGQLIFLFFQPGSGELDELLYFCFSAGHFGKRFKFDWNSFRVSFEPQVIMKWQKGFSRLGASNSFGFDKKIKEIKGSRHSRLWNDVKPQCCNSSSGGGSI
jgi:hypothetical protein